MFYILISGENADRYAFYQKDDITPVPEGALKISPRSHAKYFQGNQSEFRWKDNGTGYASLVAVEPPEVPETFKSLTPRQFSRVLLLIGLNDDAILAEIEKIEDEMERENARIDFVKATKFDRDYPLVDEIAGRMGIPPEQVNDLWHYGEDI